MNVIEHFRKQAINDLFKMKSFNNSWTVWEPELKRLLGSNLTAANILDIGDNLSQIFKTTGTAGRAQGVVSAGGAAWEALVCYYINLCTVNSRIVAIRKMSAVPKNIQDAITVNYSNFACNTESDITIITFPELPEYNDDMNSVNFNNGAITRNLLNNRGNVDLVVLNDIIERDFTQFEIGIIQCKTNWNDNAQIPMLWDMIYSAGGFSGRNITIGRNNFSIQNCNKFTYSFVTVPSNNTPYKDIAVAVKRVYNLSGGNYWGKLTQANVCRSLKEIFSNNYANGFINGGARAGITAVLAEFENTGSYSYFRIK